MLDGFDELLQAVGVSHTDYLRKVADFQRREAVQGRPVAVLVTSRTAVADRAYVPAGTVVLRLEPFDEPRIEAWLDIWNETNAESFRAAGVAPLSATSVLAQRALAEQPLLLLMLAIYDADGNALQKLGADIGQYELYDRLLTTFARREVEKHRAGLSEADLHLAVEEELRTLSVVAFAMHNRGNLWVTEEELQADLPALFGIPRVPTAGGDLRVPLRAAQLMIGRFFFVHRARAATGADERRETFEFLHATFGEFLIARLTCQVLDSMAAQERATMMSVAAAPVDDDLLHALLSFSPLTFSTAIPGFIEEKIGAELASLTSRLYQAAGEDPPARRHGDYRPRRLPDAARFAAYSANLLLLTLCAVREVSYADLCPTTDDVVAAWRRQTLLWRSQLYGEAWTSLLFTIRVDREWQDGRRAIRLGWFNDEQDTKPIDPYWTYDLRPASTNGFSDSRESPDFFLHRANFECDRIDDVIGHALEPLARSLDASVNTFTAWSPDACSSAVRTLLEAWLLPLQDAGTDEPRGVYERVAGTAVLRSPLWGFDTDLRFAGLVLDRLATDHLVSPELAVQVLERLLGTRRLSGSLALAPHFVRCFLAFAGRESDTDLVLRDLFTDRVDAYLHVMNPADRDPLVEVIIRFQELGIPILGRATSDWHHEAVATTLARRVDLKKRWAALAADDVGDLGARGDAELVEDVADVDRGRLG
ncbi:hypothetical protein SAMN05421812_10875 [Asanoa hainanensis]|uniref:Uncharacterized protein n=1 Tax=Asanoa hainanensis TaxID=560556 RepID=A0A239NA98_9ACTN|nr:hypothetical protein [Asanoa hainanensis]SNT51917.1 hypothetical protein SAMN05421812_10875 [Asanoa hainanensis]